MTDTSIDFVMRDHILANVPGLFFREAAKEIRLASREAWSTCRDIVLLGTSHREGLFPHTRRALAESRLFNLAKGFGMDVSCVQVTGKNPGNAYTRVRSGCFEFSCHHIERGGLPREATYRTQAVEANGHVRQMELSLGDQLIDVSAPIYAYLCYETDTQNAHEVGSITVKVPRGGSLGGTICSFDVSDLMEKTITPALQNGDDEIKISPRKESAAQ